MIDHLSSPSRAASKDAELEAAYLKLLKESSSHEKAITRDLGRYVCFTYTATDEIGDTIVERFPIMLSSMMDKALARRICSTSSRLIHYTTPK